MPNRKLSLGLVRLVPFSLWVRYHCIAEGMVCKQHISAVPDQCVLCLSFLQLKAAKWQTDKQTGKAPADTIGKLSYCTCKPLGRCKHTTCCCR
jgi:hypothetical protein